MIEQEAALRIMSHPHTGPCRCIKPTQRERELAETVVNLYVKIEEMAIELADKDEEIEEFQAMNEQR